MPALLSIHDLVGIKRKNKMLQLRSMIQVADNSGAKLVQLIGIPGKTPDSVLKFEL